MKRLIAEIDVDVETKLSQAKDFYYKLKEFAISNKTNYSFDEFLKKLCDLADAKVYIKKLNEDNISVTFDIHNYTGEYTINRFDINRQLTMLIEDLTMGYFRKVLNCTKYNTYELIDLIK